MLSIPDKSAGLEPLVVHPSKTVNLLQKKVLVAMPWYKSTHPITSFCVSQILDRRRTAAALSCGDAFLVHARNKIVDYFLGTDLDFLLTIDDDMVVPFANSKFFREYTGWSEFPDPFASFHALDRLLASGKKLIGATYFGKHMKASPVFAEGPKLVDEIKKGPRDEVRPTNWCGTGCLLIHRDVCLGIEKRFPDLSRGADGKGFQGFTSSEHHAMDVIRKTKEMLSVGPMDGQKAVRAFQMLIDGEVKAKSQSGLGVGEDVIFCRRAAEAGFQPHVDLGLWCGHLGTACYPIIRQ